MNRITDNDVEELEIQEVFDADALEKELSDILKEDGQDLEEDYDDVENFLAKKNEARKQQSVLMARRRKRQLKRLSIIAAVISVLLAVTVIGVFVVFMKDATSSLKNKDVDVLAETMALESDWYSEDKSDRESSYYVGDIHETQSVTYENESEPDTVLPTEESTYESETQVPTKENETQKTTVATQPTQAVKPTTPSQGVATGSYVNITDSSIIADYVALYDVSEGKVIAGKKPYAKMYPASMTKIMTLIVACENITNWNKTTALTDGESDYLYREDASRAFWDNGSYLKAKDLIYGLVLRSGCDAAMMLARITSGSEAEFAKLMNMKCKELGISNTTHFVNSTGLHNDNQYTTAADMCKIMEYAMNNELCAKVLGTASYTYTKNGAKYTWKHFNYQWYNEKYYYNNTIAKNALTKRGFSVIGAKSGYTSEAGRCLATCFLKNNRKYITVVAHSDTVYLSTQDSTNVILKYGP